MKKKTKNELFIELANPNSEWFSRRVNIDEFQWDYIWLVFGNWADWARSDWQLAKKYIIEFDKSITPWNRNDRVRLNWLKLESNQTNQIRKDIKDYYWSKRCVILDTSKPEIDHKNWRKNDPKAMVLKTQELSDFQPLSKAANDAKRQHCKNCINTNNRFDAKNIWYSISFTEWWHKHDNTENWCIWCFWYDPIEFRKKLNWSWN